MKSHHDHNRTLDLMTHDQRSLLTAILAYPEDDTPRLIYADWLEENGEGERAAFIRAKVALSLLSECGHDWCIYSPSTCPTCRRKDEIWQSNIAKDGMPLWTGLYYRWFPPIEDGLEFELSRGFIGSITCSWADWQAHADKLTWWPEATDVCPACQQARELDIRAFGTDVGVICKRCYDPELDRSPGRIPRPITLAMQPITEVTLTTWPDMSISEGPTEYVLRERWASVKKWNLGAHNESSVRS